MKMTKFTHYLPDNSRTFIIEDTKSMPLNPRTLGTIFEIFNSHSYFRGRGFQGIKYITLQGFYYQSDTPNAYYNIHEYSNDIDLIHGLIRISTYNTPKDYVSSIKNIQNIENKFYPKYKLRAWSDEISTVNPYLQIREEGDALKLLLNRLNSRGNCNDETLKILNEMLKNQRCLPSLVNGVRDYKLYNKFYYGI